ncbi:MAG: hypothetical protein NVSMB13_15610 [Mycobacteriales bacterium]
MDADYRADMVFIGGWRSGGSRRRGGGFGGPYGGPYGGYRRRGGGSCLRDACLLEGGCCLGEALSENCLVLTVVMAPRLVLALLTGSVGARGQGPTDDGPWKRRMIAAIRVYQQRISPRLSGSCRFTPSCSAYAVEALQTHGTRTALALTLGRLVRCRPNGQRGADPVPAATQ